MAIVALKYGNNSIAGTYEFACDKISEVADLPTTTEGGKNQFANFKAPATMGSTCIVGNEGSDLAVFMLFSFGWKQL